MMSQIDVKCLYVYEQAPYTAGWVIYDLATLFENAPCNEKFAVTICDDTSTSMNLVRRLVSAHVCAT